MKTTNPLAQGAVKRHYHLRSILPAPRPPLSPLLIQANACALAGYTGVAAALVKLHGSGEK